MNPVSKLSSTSAHLVGTPAATRVLAVVVLYRMLPAESPALQALEAVRKADVSLLDTIDVLVWDNTPGNREPPLAFAAHYHHAPGNPGLAAAYNAALQQAPEQGCAWLLLLDQDTTVTASYLHEALSVANATRAAALVPRLVHDGAVVSPFQPTVQGPVRPVSQALQGIAAEPLQAFNSGAVLRVAAIEAVGGFDAAFPLDYLDHATFAALQQAGGGVYVLRSELQHDLSTNTHAALDENALRRQIDILKAEHRFVAKYGTDQQRRMMPVRTLRYAFSVLVHKRDMRHAWLILKTALAAGR